MISEQNKAIAEAIRSTGLNTYKTLRDYLEMAKAIAEPEGDNDLAYAIEMTGEIKAIVPKLPLTQEFNDLYWQAMLFEAPYRFDSYLLYLERKRERKEKFYAPKRVQLNKHGLIQAMQDLEDDKLDILSISMPPGTQKTTLEKFFASWIIGRHPEDYSLFFSHSGDITRMFYDGVIDITTNDSEYCWYEIFPNVRLRQQMLREKQ